MNLSSRASELAALHDWEVLSDTELEGTSERTFVQTEEGTPSLLYSWKDEAAAQRAAFVHETAGQQLFVVPELETSGPGWILVERPAGIPARQALGAGSDPLHEVGSDRAVEIVTSLGEVIRKLHNLPVDAACGDVLEDAGPDARFLTFSGYVAHQLERFNENLRRQDFSDAVKGRLSTSIADLRHELSAFHPRNPSSLAHGGLSFDHIWLDESGREVLALTGFDRAALLPREADLAHALWLGGIAFDDRLVRALYDGYGAARTMDVQRRERFYRRLVAFQALSGLKGSVEVSTERLIELTSPQALV